MSPSTPRSEVVKADTFHGTGKVSVDTQPDPTILPPYDPIVRVTSTALCGLTPTDWRDPTQLD